MSIAHLVLTASTLLGWSDITIQAARGDRGLTAFQQSVAGIDRPSPRTLETLRRYDLEKRYRKDVEHTLLSLEKLARAQPSAEIVYALAELSWLDGCKNDRWRKAVAVGRYQDAVAYAYDYLFDPELAGGRAPADPRYRLACEIYNAGLERIIRAAQSKNPIDPQGKIKLKAGDREQELQVSLRDSPWKAADIHKLLPTSDYEVGGLATSRNQYGIGVPLIAVRESDPKQADRPANEQFYPAEMAFPLTAFLVPDSRLREPGEAVDQVRQCTLQLVDPIQYQVVGEPGNQIALEIDLTTPLAYMWSNTDLERFRWSGLIRPEQLLERANLLMIRPYEPGKIPVVMVHGLISSPLAWIPMLNELQRDPDIRDRYQFFLYMYPTGVPLPIAAANLRDALAQAKATYDPDGRDPAFDRMVLLGHSMGGLLSHCMVVSSGEQLWQLNSDQTFDDILGPPDVLAQLRKLLFFEPLPFVKRVVFLATPHRGSDLSRSVIGRVSTNLISDPDYIHKLLSQLVKDNPDAFNRRFRRFPSSIETLATDSPILMAILDMQPAAGVVFHSIIGSIRPDDRRQTTDGVVPYRSSHLEGAASEKIVRSDHGVQKDALAIREVRRILQEHLGLADPADSRDPAEPPAVASPASAADALSDLPALPR
ncbi:esterase/lipase family protein [Planctomyces sp. SH-PL62]|uniref:esterase/lipase family protein n=1 Tax=Planctomyces sp. SH-PL62 TaxID=1636152 RepID=UPI00078DEB0A|nr:hypothetical protein [Planctomyces sp. SH-PL62]AMV39591.1 hypothetical protein VT85_19305 [Planctomyces sp. SH-PL62]